MGKCKSRYLGRFNYCKQIHVLYTFATSEKKAKANFINQLAEILKREPWSLKGLYDGYLDNYNIMLETEFEEIEENEMS